MFFSMRAEHLADFNRFMALVKSDDLILDHRVNPDPDGLPDIEVEFKSSATLGQIADALRRLPDGHTMLQTLRPVPLAENSFERDYDIH